MTWKHAGKKDGKTIMHFTKPEEFFAYASKLDKRTIIYIDSILENGVKGEEVAKEIAALGFTELWLCTGLPPIGFETMKQFRSCVSKDPAWLPSSQRW